MHLITALLFRNNTPILFSIFIGFSLLAMPINSANEIITEHISVIRTIKATDNDETLKQFNKDLDAAWSYFNANKELSLPILTIVLEQELREQSPNDFVLLDVGYFLYLHGDKVQQLLAKMALYSLDANKKIIQYNIRQLFDFALKVSADRDPDILPFLSKTFLSNQERSIYIPQHSLELDPTLICVFLYGIYGEGAENELITELTTAKNPNRILEVLSWIGSEESVHAVESAMYKNKNYDTLARSVSFFMILAGEKGKAKMTNFKDTGFDERSRSYYKKLKEPIGSQSYATIYQQFESFGGDNNLSEAKLKKRFSAMYDNYGKDENTSPLSILNSTLPKEYLIGELLKIRSRMFNRLSDEALSDVKISNALINALYYRDK